MATYPSKSYQSNPDGSFKLRHSLSLRGKESLRNGGGVTGRSDSAVYAGLYPNDMAVMILVDAAHEDQQKRLESVQPPALIAENNREVASYQRWERFRRPFMLHLGIERFIIHFMHQSEQMPQMFWEEYFYLSQKPGFQETVASEMRSLPDSSSALKAANTPPPLDVRRFRMSSTSDCAPSLGAEGR